MKIACPKCGREYRLDPSRIPAKGARFTCWGCQAKVEVRPLQAGQTDTQASVTALPNKDAQEAKKPALAEASAGATAAVKDQPQASLNNEAVDSENYVTGPGISKASLMPEIKKSEAKSSEPVAQPEPTAQPEAKSQPEAKLEATAKADEKAHAKAVADTAATKSEPDAKSEPAAAKSDAKSDAKSETVTKTDSAVKRTTGNIGSSSTGQLKPPPLKITCPKCHHEYRIDPSRIPSGGGKFTCRNCQARIEVRPNSKQDDSQPSGPITSPLSAPPVTPAKLDNPVAESAPEPPPTVPVAQPAAQSAANQKVSTSKYLTPAAPQPAGAPNFNFDLGDNKAEVKEAQATPVSEAKPASPFDFDFTKPASEQETQKAEASDTFDGESTMVMGSPLQTSTDKNAEKASVVPPAKEVKEPPPVKEFSFSLDNEDAKPAPAKTAEPANPFSLDLPPSTLKMSGQDLASAVEAHTKATPEAKPAEKPAQKAPNFQFDLNAGEPTVRLTDPTKAEPFKEAEPVKAEPVKAEPVKASPVDPFATMAIPAANAANIANKPPEASKADPQVNVPTVISKALPLGGAFDGQETAPLTPFSFDLSASPTTDKKPADADPELHKKTLEAPAVSEETLAKPPAKPEFTFDLSHQPPPPEPVESTKAEANPFGLSAKPSKVGGDNPFDLKTEPATPAAAKPAKPEGRSADTPIKVDDDYSFKDLLDKPIGAKESTPAKPAEAQKVEAKKADAPAKADVAKPKEEKKEEPKPAKSDSAKAGVASTGKTPGDTMPPPAKPLPKPDLLNKPLKEKEPPPLPEYSEGQLPTPIYNPDVFKPLPDADKSKRPSGLKIGALLGGIVAIAVIVGLWLTWPAKKPSDGNGSQVATNKTPKPSPSPTGSTVKPTPSPTPSGKPTTDPVKPTPSPTPNNVKPSPTPSPTPVKPTPTPTPVKPTPTPTPVKPTPTPTPVKPTPTPTPVKPSPTPTPVKPTPTPTPTPKPTNPVIASNPPAGNGKFTIQVGATPSQSEAETLSKRLRGSGVEVYVVKADLGSKGIWYRVRTGRYQSSGDAQKAAAGLKSKGLISEFIVSTF